MRISPKWGWFAAFTAVFAVCAAYVFWGSWGPNMGFVCPDNEIVLSHSYWDTVQSWWNMFSTTGKSHPMDVFWSGLLNSPLTCCQLRYLVSSYLAAIAMAWFLRGHGLSRLSSYGAGLFYAFSGYGFTLFSAGHGNWFVWMGYGVFSFGLIDRAVEEGRFRYWVLLGVAEAWSSFYAPDIWLLFAVVTFAYFVFRTVQRRRLNFKGLFAAAGVFLSVAAPSIYSAFANDLAGRDKQIEEGQTVGSNTKLDDSEKRWIFATNWSLPPDETLEFLVPRVNGDTSCPLTLSIGYRLGTGVRPYTGALGRPYGAPHGNYRQHSLYVGFVTCLFAVVGIAMAFARKREEILPDCDGSREISYGHGHPCRNVVFFFSAAAALFWLFSLGRYCEPVYRLVYALPFGDYLRAPVKWHHLTEFCICVLSGYGIEGACSLMARRKAARAAIAVLVIFGSLNLASIAHLYCAPIDYSRAIKMKCSSRLMVLPRQQFADPNVADMMRRGYIVPIANWLGGSEAVLVQLLEPAKSSKPVPAKPLNLGLGILSVLSALAALGASFINWKKEQARGEGMA